MSDNRSSNADRREAVPEPTAASNDRRQFMRKVAVGAGAAWVTPVIVTSVTAPAAAASGEAPDMSFTAAGGNGWTTQVVSGVLGAGTAGFVASYGALAPAHLVEADAVGTMTVEARKSIDLVAGCTYTFAYSTSAYNINAADQQLQVLVDSTLLNHHTTSTSPPVGQQATGHQTVQNHSVSFPATTTGTFVFTYRHIVDTGVGDDIGVTFPVVTVT